MGWARYLATGFALNAVGTALGGPIGGAIGGLIGQGIDRSLFGPGPRRGPRLNDLSVQTSSYGTQIPRVYGSMRVAGTIVWATELREASELVGDTVVYTYSVSLAVALSSRPARDVGRIWADGKLLRGAAGDFKVRTDFRFYQGDEDQAADPLIASIEGIDSAPAYRGLALAVFENLQLSEFGGRIPALTFELIGDDGEASLGAIVNDVGGGAIACEAPDTIEGYAAYGGSRRSAIAPLVEHFGIPLLDDGERLTTPNALPVVSAKQDETGYASGEQIGLGPERSQVPAGALPRSLTITHYDRSRDFQLGQMRAVVGSVVGIDEAAELPAVLDSGKAKGLAETIIARRWAERDKLVLRLPPDRFAIAPGRTIQLEDGSFWRVDSAALEEFVLRVELSREAKSLAPVRADPGRYLSAPDLIALPTTLVVLDLPDLGTGRHDVPTLQVAACQVGIPWSQVPIEVTWDGEVRTIASAPAEAIIGSALTVLGDGPSVDVELEDPEHWLESRDDGALANGANLAAIGSELFQFGVAEPIGEKRFRLNQLRRGRWGTEFAMGSHVGDERFVLIEPGVLREVVFSPAAIGTPASVKARSLADGEADPVQRTIAGEAMRPPSPVDLLAEIASDGALTISWTRRSRLAFSWPEGAEVPLGESSERYRLTLLGSAGTMNLETAETRATVPGDTLGGMSGTLTISVVQVGDFAESRPATVSVTMGGAG